MIWAILAGLLALALLLSLRRWSDPWRPVALADLEPVSLARRLQLDLERSASWKQAAGAPGLQVAKGWLPEVPCLAYRSDVVLDADLATVSRFLADDQLARLPDWNREFQSGRVLRVLEETSTRKAWLIQVSYATPFFMRDREYLYYLAREQLDADRVLISYHSVDEEVPFLPGHTRAVLYPSVHRCTRIDDHRTRVEHILANDVRGALSPWVQSRLLAGAFVAANLRDIQAQKRLFAATKD